MHELGHPHELIELQLAHQERNAVSAAYNHATYLPQRLKQAEHGALDVDLLALRQRIADLASRLT